jgi:hypothetical protein
VLVAPRSACPVGTVTLQGHLAGAGALVREPRQSEEQIGESVEIDHRELRQLDAVLKSYHVPFGAPADGARDVQRSGLRRATGNDERAQWLELRLGVVDRLLELRDALVVDAGPLEMLRHLLAVRSGEQRTDGKQVALHGDEHLIDARHLLDGARHPDDGVQLVDVTIRLDARVVLRDAPTAEQPRVAGVSGSRVDLHGGKYSVGGGCLAPL